MKNYAEFLRDFIGRKGALVSSDQCYIFSTSKLSTNDSGSATLTDIGHDYAEFWVGHEKGSYHRVVPLSLLVVTVN